MLSTTTSPERPRSRFTSAGAPRARAPRRRTGPSRPCTPSTELADQAGRRRHRPTPWLARPSAAESATAVVGAECRSRSRRPAVPPPGRTRPTAFPPWARPRRQSGLVPGALRAAARRRPDRSRVRGPCRGALQAATGRPSGWKLWPAWPERDAGGFPSLERRRGGPGEGGRSTAVGVDRRARIILPATTGENRRAETRRGGARRTSGTRDTGQKEKDGAETSCSRTSTSETPPDVTPRLCAGPGLIERPGPRAGPAVSGASSTS